MPNSWRSRNSATHSAVVSGCYRLNVRLFKRLPITSDVGMQNSELYRRAIEQFNVQYSHVKRYRPDPQTTLDTRCNIFAGDVMQAMNVPSPTKAGRHQRLKQERRCPELVVQEHRWCQRPTLTRSVPASPLTSMAVSDVAEHHDALLGTCHCGYPTRWSCGSPRRRPQSFPFPPQTLSGLAKMACGTSLSTDNANEIVAIVSGHVDIFEQAVLD